MRRDIKQPSTRLNPIYTTNDTNLVLAEREHRHWIFGEEELARQMCGGISFVLRLAS
jgi:hypothetical protein